VSLASDDDGASLVPAAVPLPGPPSRQRGSGRVRDRLRAVTARLRDALQGPWRRERQLIRAEFGRHALLPLLMKGRNGAGWTCDERIQLWHHLQQVASLSPYLIVLPAPGSMVLLPVVAWWLDRRRLLRALARANRVAHRPPVN
jgi:hypothetical protein